MVRQLIRVLSTLIADQDSSGPDVVLLCDSLHTLLVEEWTAGAAEWAVCFYEDAFLFAKVGYLLLW